MSNIEKEAHIKIYRMVVNYHTKATTEYEVFAPDLNSAYAVAAAMFDNNYTEKCIRDSVEERLQVDKK